MNAAQLRGTVVHTIKYMSARPRFIVWACSTDPLSNFFLSFYNSEKTLNKIVIHFSPHNSNIVAHDCMARNTVRVDA